MSASRSINFLSGDASSFKRRQTSSQDKGGFNVVTEIDSPSINRSAFVSKSLSSGHRKGPKAVPAWATPTNIPTRNPFIASQASTSSYITTPSASPPSPSHSIHSINSHLSREKPSGIYSPICSPNPTTIKTARHKDKSQIFLKKPPVSSILLQKSNRSPTPRTSTHLKPSINSASRTPNLAAQITSSSLANAALRRSTSVASMSPIHHTTPKAVIKPSHKHFVSQSAAPVKEKSKPPVVTEVIPTSDDDEMEIDQDSVIVLGSLEAATRKCSRPACRNVVPRDFEFRLCDPCRTKSREVARRRAERRKQAATLSNPPAIDAVSEALPVDTLNAASAPTAGPNSLNPTGSSLELDSSDGQSLPQHLNVPSYSTSFGNENPKPQHSMIAFNDVTDTSPTTLTHPPPTQTSGFKEWMRKLRHSEKLGPGGTHPESSNGMSVDERPTKKSRHQAPPDMSLGRQFQDVDALCTSLVSYMGELRRSGPQKVCDFVGHYTVVSPPTTEFFAHKAQLTVDILVQKAGLSVRQDMQPGTFSNESSYQIRLPCSCSVVPGAPFVGHSSCSGYITLHMQKLRSEVASGTITADQVVLRIEHRPTTGLNLGDVK